MNKKEQKYYDVIVKSEELWEWLTDNPLKSKQDFPNYKKYNIDKAISRCLICSYRNKLNTDWLDFCEKMDKVPTCFLNDLCGDVYNNFYDSIFCEDAEGHYENAKKIYMAILKERLRIM